jgi:hypothetical protein
MYADRVPNGDRVDRVSEYRSRCRFEKKDRIAAVQFPRSASLKVFTAFYLSETEKEFELANVETCQVF